MDWRGGVVPDLTGTLCPAVEKQFADTFEFKGSRNPRRIRRTCECCYRGYSVDVRPWLTTIRGEFRECGELGESASD
jgi:hypothetical protein